MFSSLVLVDEVAARLLARGSEAAQVEGDLLSIGVGSLETEPGVVGRGASGGFLWVRSEALDEPYVGVARFFDGLYGVDVRDGLALCPVEECDASHSVEDPRADDAHEDCDDGKYDDDLDQTHASPALVEHPFHGSSFPRVE